MYLTVPGIELATCSVQSVLPIPLGHSYHLTPNNRSVQGYNLGVVILGVVIILGMVTLGVIILVVVILNVVILGVVILGVDILGVDILTV